VPRVYQSGRHHQRGPLAKNGPTYLRWALIEAATMPPATLSIATTTSPPARWPRHPAGPAVARLELARKLAEAIWHLLTTQAPSARQGPTHCLWPHDGPQLRWPAGRPDPTRSSPQEAIER
jgi:transposase